ncbi:MAG: hypothetical protein ABIH36_01810 [bacterium]
MKKMKKMDLRKLVKRETWLHLVRRVRTGVRAGGRWLLIRHSHALDVAAVALVLLIAGYLVITLLYLEPPGVNAAPPGQLELATDVIDRLELWIEQWDTDLSSSLKIPEGVL